MELIVAILIALGFLSSPDMYTEEYISTQQKEIDQANYIIDNNYYAEKDGGVIIDIDGTSD